MSQSRPRLKNGVDIQLQSAFSEGNWPLVVRLAENRFRSLKDEYYSVLKICAESQLDDPVAKFSAVTAVQTYLKDGTVIKDVDAIDLLEWATLDLTEEDDFLTTLGPLRVKAVKAAPTNKAAATRNFESCLVHWDIASAQQIAGILDRSFPGERRYMFWNIAITHMLAISPQTLPDKKKLYATLALRQIERAAEVSEQAETPADDSKPSHRGVSSEEEVLLLYEIITTHGSAADFEKLTKSALFSPSKQFSQGSKEVLLRAIAKFKKDGNWKAVFDICESSLSQTDEAGKPTLLASDLVVWKEFITAASYLKLVNDEAPTTVRNLLLKLIQAPNLRTIYRRNLLLARLSAAFQLARHDGEDSIEDQASSLRLRELIKYIGSQNEFQSCFDDVKPFVEQLDRSGIRYFLRICIPHLHDTSTDDYHSHRLRLLGYKLKYFILSCPVYYTTIPGSKPRFTCMSCEGELEYQSCRECFGEVYQRCLDLYEIISIEEPDTLSTDSVPADLVIMAALCAVKLASANPDVPCSSLPSSSFRYIMRGLLLLERQLAFSPKNSQILLLLLQLHLLVGSAPRTTYLFEELSVKRTIMDSLAPIFYDRLTTVAPKLLDPDEDLGYHLADALSGHYQNSLKLRMPRRLVDAFASDNYSSILDIPQYITALRNSATRAMSLVEELRSERMLGAPTWELFSQVRYLEVTDDTKLVSVVDYGSFPSWDSASRPPAYARLRLGPVPTNRRMHVSLLAEAFHDVLGYKPPSPYKVPAASNPSDHTFVLESLSHISNSFSKFLPGTEVDFTPSELVYFELASVLSTAVLLCVQGGRDESDTEAACQLVDAAAAALDTLKSYIPQDDPSAGIDEAMALLTNLHAVGIYREAAEAVSLASQWILDFNAREKERDRSGQSNLPKNLGTKVKDLNASSTSGLKDGKGWIVALGRAVKAADFQSRFLHWAFSTDHDNEIMMTQRTKQFIENDFVAEQVARMRENVDGWQKVKWD